MTFEETSNIVKSKKHLLLHTYNDTIDMVLMDLYIAYQDDVQEATAKRAYLKESIKAIVDSFISPKSVDGENWEVEDVSARHIQEDILLALNFILKPDSPKPSYIPQIFSKRLTQKGLELTVSDFYCYR